MMLSLADYWMGRDVEFAADLTDEIRDSAIELLGRVNLLLSWARADGVSHDGVASGWRPPLLNARIGGGPLHQQAEAIDLRDLPPDRALARWCLRNLDALGEIGLWMEDPQWTPTWVHLQKVPPRSGRRVYIPNSNPPIAARLPEQITRVTTA